MTAMDLEEIRRYVPQIYQIAAKFGISKIFIVGSVARGDQTFHSDLDLLIEVEEGVSLFNVAGFAYECERLIGKKIDVIPLSVIEKQSDQNFYNKIRKEAVPI